MAQEASYTAAVSSLDKREELMGDLEVSRLCVCVGTEVGVWTNAAASSFSLDTSFYIKCRQVWGVCPCCFSACVCVLSPVYHLVSVSLRCHLLHTLTADGTPSKVSYAHVSIKIYVALFWWYTVA